MKLAECFTFILPTWPVFVAAFTVTTILTSDQSLLQPLLCYCLDQWPVCIAAFTVTTTVLTGDHAVFIPALIGVYEYNYYYAYYIYSQRSIALEDAMFLMFVSP